MTDQQLLKEAELYVAQYFRDHLAPDFVFHDLEHTAQVTTAARMLGQGFGLSEHELTLLQLAGWFHDTGYMEGPEGHEERSRLIAESFLKEKLDDESVKMVGACIRATKLPQQPVTLLEKILCDADLSHLGMKIYWDRTGKLRQEFILTRKQIMSEQEWIDFELEFMLSHEYHTSVAKETFNKRKAKHIQQLLKQKRRLRPDEAPSVSDIAATALNERESDLNKMLQDSERELTQTRLGRGVETMYRTTYRTHTNLSQMADSKANLMLSVNAIVISILISNLLPKLQEMPKLILPTILLTLTCLGSMVYATLSTRPKVTEGKVTRDDIQKRKANLLFFGNFHNMPLDDFQWGVNEMIKDQQFLYSSMSRDLYFLGIVLAKKYKYLSICYNLFMYGLIASVLSFGAAFLL